MHTDAIFGERHHKVIPKVHSVNFGEAKGIVFLVDDDEDFVECMEEYLEEEGYLCMLAIGGYEALPMMKDINTPAIAIVDLRMPQMDGFELIETMKLDTKLSEIPIVVCTGQFVKEVPGVDQILYKPCSLAQIAASVRTAFTKVIH